MTAVQPPDRMAEDPLVTYAQARARAARPGFSAAMLGRFGLAPADIPDIATLAKGAAGKVDYAALAKSALAGGLPGMAGPGGLSALPGKSGGAAPSAMPSLAFALMGQGLSDGARRDFEMMAEYRQRLAHLKESGADPAAIRSAERVLGELNKLAAQRLMTDALFPAKEEERGRSRHA